MEVEFLFNSMTILVPGSQFFDFSVFRPTIIEKKY